MKDFIKPKHDEIFKNVTTKLLTNLGESMSLYNYGADIDCTFCKKDTATGRSSGIPEDDKIWSDHPNYQGNQLRCPECFCEDVLVITDSGIKEIKDIKVGDRVITHEGRFRKVNKVYKSKYKGDLKNITVFSGYDFSCTPNHKLFGVSSKPCNGKGREDINFWLCNQFKKKKCNCNNKDYLEKIEAKDLNKSSFLFNVKLPSILELEYEDNYIKPKVAYREKKEEYLKLMFKDKDFPIIVGLYIAEGCSGKREISFSFNRSEKLYQNFVKRFFEKYGFYVNIYKRKDSNCNVVSISSVRLQNWFESNCGKLSHNKIIPNTLFLSNNIDRIKVLSGIFMGDGHKIKRHKYQKNIGVTSKKLQLQVLVLLDHFDYLARMYYTPARIRYGMKKKPAYIVEWFFKFTKRLKSFVNKYGKFTIIKDIKTIKNVDTYVYNLEVEEDHSYNVNGSIVKNCFGRGDVVTWSIREINKLFIQDISGLQFVKGKQGYYSDGTKEVQGLLSDVFEGNRNMMEEAKKIRIDGDDYRVRSFEKLGLRDDHLFRAIIERSDLIESNL